MTRTVLASLALATLVDVTAVTPALAAEEMAEPVTQMHQHRHLIGASVESVSSSPHPLAPAPLQEHRRDTIRQFAPLPAIDRPQHVDRGEDRVVRFERAEHEGLEENHRCLAQRRMAPDQLGLRPGLTVMRAYNPAETPT
jgi:hypothetical protein